MTRDLQGESLANFIGIIQKAYIEKQTSEDDSLSSYQITGEELEKMWAEYQVPSSKSKQHGDNKRKSFNASTR